MYKKIIYFDVCGTLYSVNTTFDFVKFYHRNQKHYIRFILCLFLSGFFAKVLHRLFHFPIRKIFLITLNGEKKTNLNNVAVVYFNSVLVNKKINKIHHIFDEYRKDKNVQIKLLSASIEPIILAISNHYNISYSCTGLEYADNEYCTGKLIQDLKGRKDKCLFDDDRLSFFYSDNLDDLICAPLVTKYFFVNRKEELLLDKGLYNNVEIINI